MKIFFHVFLYLNTGLCALFFVAWFLTSLPLFQSSAVAQQPAGNTSARTGSTLAPDDLNDKMRKNDTVEQKEASVSEPLSDPKKAVPPATRGINSVPPPPPSVDNDTEGGVSSGMKAPDTAIAPAETEATNSVPPPPPPPSEIDNLNDDTADVSSGMEGEEGKADDSSFPPAGKTSPTLNSVFESVKQLKDQQGVGADAARDLENINKKLVDIHEMLKKFDYEYNNRRNPFAPFKSEMEVEAGSVVSPIYNYPTGKFDLGELELIGVKWNSKLGPSKALFKTPDGIIHHLQVNHWIGNNRGIIYEIREDEVIILEPKVEGGTGMSEDSYIPVIIRLDRWKEKERNSSPSVVAPPAALPATKPPSVSGPQI